VSFVRVKPSGWAVGDILQSSEMNQADINISSALDKSTSGDTLSGVIVMQSTAQIVAGFPGNIAVGFPGALVATTAGAIKSTAPGAIQLAGGGADYPSFSVARSRVINGPLVPQYVDGASWQAANGFGAVTGQAISIPLVVLFPQMHNGSLLTSVTIALTVMGPSGSRTNLPSALPSFDVRRASATTPSATTVSLFSGGRASPSPGSGSAWFNSGIAQNWIGTPDQNNLIDTTSFYYYILLFDETGTFALAGNQYTGMSATFTQIPDMAFP
jgi:hypothetical protein